MSASRNRLIIGTRRYSSWSLRGWLAVRAANLDVTDHVIPLAGDGQTVALKILSPTGLVPVLEHDGTRIWDTLAIAEYCAELAPLWPAARAARATARSMAAEMHAGFPALRRALPMNLGRHDRPPKDPLTPETRSDIDRVATLFRAADGGYLFGPDLTVADIMFAPVVSRFLSYGLVPDGTRAYCDAIRNHPLVARWYEQAANEPADWQLSRYEQV